ncbi:MAG: hypothetical protein ABJP82_01125, partial [Hyphomicrobiales bacterium]
MATLSAERSSVELAANDRSLPIRLVPLFELPCSNTKLSTLDAMRICAYTTAAFRADFSACDTPAYKKDPAH